MNKQQKDSMNSKEHQKKEIKNGLHNELILRTMVNNSFDTIYFKDIGSKFIFNSLAHAIQQGEARVEDMRGKSDFDYFPEAFALQSYEEEQKIMKTGKPLIGHIEKWVRDDGSVVWLSASKYPLYDEEGIIRGTWGTSRDVTRMKEVEEELKRVNEELKDANCRLELLSTRDALSGLYNHRHFYDSLTFEIASKERAEENKQASSFAIMIIDIDHFKEINDSYGHLIGDFVIKSIGEYLIKSTRLIDTCFRYGGDEFALILKEINLENAKIIAEKIRHNIESIKIVYKEITIQVTVSIGLVVSYEASTINGLIELGDNRLYMSKKAGRNTVT